MSHIARRPVYDDSDHVVEISDLERKLFYEAKNKGIMQTCPCNVDPLTPQFYIVNLGFRGVYIIFLLLL